jgi:hypothetical protein
MECGAMEFEAGGFGAGEFGRWKANLAGGKVFK